ncbi:F-box/WD repeat-containing protein 2-like [Homarus americanus]|uniref:F-box/WD repeat-containing protein 2-like n=1 Tax=Homarus americanus TaxID=6706 RepID=UPI001C47180F|nr:F-box/WD repeat-containing protein 2-like [Homarus americanus]
MNSLLEKVKELDHQDQQKLVTALVTTLPPEGQQALLLPTVTAASSYVKWRLVSFISGQDTPDLLTLLPPELQIAVLQFVDGPSLLNATQVSREWNGIIKNHNHIWVKKCKELGVNIEKVHCGANWHQAYVSSLRQQLSLKNGTAFSERFMQLQNCKKAVKAVDYQNGFLCTVSEEDYVNIWQLELNIPVLAFPVERAVSCIKFRPNSLLICGHFVGILTAWDLSKMSEVSCVIDNSLGNSPGQYFLLWSKFKMHAGPVFSSDFSEELDLLVSGGADECIKLWCLSTGLVIKSLPNQDHWVLRVILLPDLSCSFYHEIICMTRDNVNKISWPASSNKNSDDKLNTTENITNDNSELNSVCLMDKIGNIDEILLKSCIRLNEGNNNFFTPGLQYSTKYVGLIKQDIDEKHANLCVYEIETFKLLYNIILKFKVKKLLALGNRYALLLTIGSVLYSSTLVVVDVVTGETAGTHAVPHSKMTTPDGAQLVVGDIDWLNGLGGHLLDLSEPPLTTEFNNDQSNEVKSTKSCCSDAERQQNLNKVSSVVSSEDSHKIFQQNRSPECGTQQFSPCQPAELCECRDAEEEVSPIGAVGGELPVCMMGNSDTNLHYSNNNSPATISSEDVPLQAASLQYHGSNMNCTKDTQLSVRLERPGHLVLAAGVQSEPGRLFTLWWSNSKQTLKCKKE